VRLAEASLAGSGDSVLGVVVNRVDPTWLAEVTDQLSRRPAGAAPAWALPEHDELRHPTLGELGRALDAVLVSGSAEDLARDVRFVKVAAMSVANLLDHIEDGTVLIVPGDRADVLLAAALTRMSDTYPSVAGVLLSGGLRPDTRVTKLIEGLGAGGRPLPMLEVSRDTFDTASAAASVEGQLTVESERKIQAALGLFEAHVDLSDLASRVEVASSGVVTPVMFQYELIERAKAAGAHIVLPEGNDDRVLEAAERLRRRDVGSLTLLGREADVRSRASELGLGLEGIPIIDPSTSPWLETFARTYHELRGHKGVTADQARDLMTDESFFATMMVHRGLADGMVSGAAHTTAHTIRPALEIIRTAPGVSTVSSVFLMLLADRVLVYGDCAVIPDPDAVQLADIAISSAETAVLFGIEPRIAMLSYSTGESGRGAEVDKVREATERVRAAQPDLMVEGPIQYDAAVDASVARTKLPGSEVAGQATVFIFPDLNTGNNTYKAVQRTAGAVAVGPVLQGLNRPVNDLSRGATVTDIVNTVAITGIQARASR
jgi:phosphate acetyltransferase